MKATERCVLLAVDAPSSYEEAVYVIKGVAEGPIGPYLAGIKLNDVLDAPFSHDVLQFWRANICKKMVTFVDLKLADVGDTCVNRVRRYYSFSRRICGDLVRFYDSGLIVTVSLHASLQTFIGLTKEFQGITIAAMGVPTDWTSDECEKFYGMSPDEAMHRWLMCKQYGQPADMPLIITAAIASFDMLAMMGEVYPNIACITPGIRDKWMLKGAQKRTVSTADALRSGATYVVMGSQLTRGNPEQDITPERSQELTAEQIKSVLGV